MLTTRTDGPFTVILDGDEEVRRVRDPARAAAYIARHGARQPATAPVDLAILDGSIAELRDALATGEHDGHLAELLAAEEAGKTRKGAVAAIRERMG